jgi:hypothetical protein
VHCSTPDCGGMCTLEKKIVQCPIILIIEPCAVNACPIMSMNDIEHELIIDGTRHMLVCYFKQFKPLSRSHSNQPSICAI